MVRAKRVCSMVQSVSRIVPKATATSVPPASNSTMADTTLGTVPTSTSEPRKRCGGCAQKTQCTRSPLKYLAIHVHEPARQRARDLVDTPAFFEAQRKRKKV